MRSAVYYHYRMSLQAAHRALEDLIAAQPTSDALLGSLKEVEDALWRIVFGQYGICEQCKRPIAEDVLDHTPAARYCKECMELRAPVITTDRDVE